MSISADVAMMTELLCLLCLSTLSVFERARVHSATGQMSCPSVKGILTSQNLMATAAQRAEIDRAIAAGVQTRTSRMGRASLATGASGGARYRILADAGGRLTAMGRHYYEQTGQPAPSAAYNRNQELITTWWIPGL